jgi:hypothetical protein
LLLSKTTKKSDENREELSLTENAYSAVINQLNITDFKHAVQP